MSLELPRLPLLDLAASKFEDFIGIFRNWYSQFQIFWQKVVEAIEAQEALQDSTIADLATVVARIDAQDDILTAALVRLGAVEVLADGTYALTTGTIDTDGTIKANKVLTHSAVAAAFTQPVSEVGADVTIPAAGTETLLYISSVQTVGDATYGSYTVGVHGGWNNAVDPDGGAEVYLETNENGAGWVRHTDYTQTFGSQTTGGGDTKSYIPLSNFYSSSGAGIITVQVQLIGKAIDLSAGLKDSTVTKPYVVIIPGKR